MPGLARTRSTRQSTQLAHPYNGKSSKTSSLTSTAASGKRSANSQESTEEEEVPVKRARAKNGAAQPAKKPAKKSEVAKKASAPRIRTVKPPVNALATPPEHPRPANQLFVWGAGNFGQFGMGPGHLDEFDKPKKNMWIEKKMEEGAFGEEDAGIECVAAGGLHTMFIDEKGTIWTCGVNDDAALGRITKDVPDPENPGSFLDVDVLTSIPHPLQTLVDEGFRAVSITAGDSICAAVSSKGELRVWGSFRANEGSLGFSGGAKHQYLPTPILHLPTRYSEAVSAVASGSNHLVVLTTHGNIYTWGAGEQGQLGRKILERSKIHGTTPEKVTLHSRALKAVAVGAGWYTSFAIDEHGDCWGWGLNNMGQTGTLDSDPATEPEPVVPQPRRVLALSKEELGGARVVQVEGGEHHTLFRTDDGRVFACGRADGGQLGLPDAHPALAPFTPGGERAGFVPRPTQVAFPDADDPIAHVSAGARFSAAVTRDGALYTWGEGNQGELGAGDKTETRTPTVVVRREGGSWKAVAAECGGQHTLGVFRKKVAS